MINKLRNAIHNQDKFDEIIYTKQNVNQPIINNPDVVNVKYHQQFISSAEESSEISSLIYQRDNNDDDVDDVDDERVESEDDDVDEHNINVRLNGLKMENSETGKMTSTSSLYLKVPNDLLQKNQSNNPNDIDEEDDDEANINRGFKQRW